MNKVVLARMATLNVLVAAVFLSGCASSYYSRGHKALEKEKYDEAIVELKQAIVQNLHDANAIRDMGIAMYYKDRPALANRFLNLAAKQRPNDAQILYYLGATYEELERPDQAIQVYSRYAELSPLNDARKQIEARLVVLLRQQMARETRKMLDQEQALNVESIPDNSVAVLYFNNLTGDEDLGPIQKGLADMLITDLSQVDELTVVERARLQQLLDEMGLGMSGMVDEQTAPRIGKLLGAARVVNGAVLSLPNQGLRIEAGFENIKSGQRENAEKMTGLMKDFYKIEKDLAFGIIDLMQIKLSSSEREAIERIPTRNLLAFISYCKALDYEDKGMWEQAGEAYQNALQKDANFGMAQNGLQRAKAFATFSSTPPKPKVGDIKPTGGTGAGKSKEPGHKEAKPTREGSLPPSLAGNRLPGGLPDATDRLFQTARNVSSGFVPGIESRKPTTETSASAFGTAAPIEVKIKLPVKQ